MKTWPRSRGVCPRSSLPVSPSQDPGLESPHVQGTGVPKPTLPSPMCLVDNLKNRCDDSDYSTVPDTLQCVARALCSQGPVEAFPSRQRALNELTNVLCFQ